MATLNVPPSRGDGAASVPSSANMLENGDRLSRGEFERRYEARPDIKKAELIEGVVHMPSSTRSSSHARPHAAMISTTSFTRTGATAYASTWSGSAWTTAPTGSSWPTAHTGRFSRTRPA